MRTITTLLTLLTLLLSAPAAAFTVLVPPGQPGFCSVTPRGELRVAEEHLVFCRWPGVDVTGDGVPEVVELRLLLTRAGQPDCARSAWVVLDVTRDRNQALSVSRVC